MQPYDVALWLTWPALFPEYVEVVAAVSPFDAAQMLMQAHGITRVAHAAVAHEGVIKRWSFLKLVSEVIQEG